MADTSKRRPRAARVIAAALVGAAALAGVPVAGAAAAPCVAWSGAQPPSQGSSGLNGVAVLSPCNAWAVGEVSNNSGIHSLIVHWNGAAWKQVAAPSFTSSDSLGAVAATSAGNAWAVGGVTGAGGLLLHWDGRAWTQVPVAAVSSATTEFRGVAAASGQNAWVVGDTLSATGPRSMLILQRDASGWHEVTLPAIPSATSSQLNSVAAVSATDAWAVGSFLDGTATRPLLLHWNGTSWLRLSGPRLSSSAFPALLTSVAATSARNAWAIGVAGSPAQGLILHWNGRAWAKAKLPGLPATSTRLLGVTATSASNAIVVGDFTPAGSSASRPLILRWNGSAWKQAMTPEPIGAEVFLTGVGASASGSAWAVGVATDSASQATTAFALHCC
jgi:hypothetical protein